MNDLPIQNTVRGWPDTLADVYGQEFVRVRDGSMVGLNPPLGNSCLYALLVPGTRTVSKERQYTPLWDWNKEVKMAGGPWLTTEQFEAAGTPGLEELPPGYRYAGE